jgi:uncharacterized integral membrane protein
MINSLLKSALMVEEICCSQTWTIPLVLQLLLLRLFGMLILAMFTVPHIVSFVLNRTLYFVPSDNVP